MRFMITGRMTGKTAYIIEQMQKNEKAICVCINQMEADRLRHLAPDINPSRFVPVGSVMRGFLRGRHDPIYIDNLEIVLQFLVGNVELATATGIVEKTQG